MKKYDEYKDSGVAWIGEVPKHWEVIKLKYKYHFQTGATPNTGKKENFEGDLRWANISDLNGSVVYDTTKHINKEAASKCSMNISPKGSLMYSFKLSVGTVAFCGEDMYTNEAIASFIPQKNDLKYLFYCAPIFIIHNANRNIYNAPLLNQELIKNALICLPSLNEQTVIAAYLDTHCAKIDNLISIQQKRIALLQELKQSVITHAVTKGLNPNVEMKPSGVEWIGDVPKHWKILRGKYVLNILSGFPFDSQKFEFEDNGVYMPLIRIRDINCSSTEVYYSGSYPIESVVKTGEVLIGMDGDFNISKWKGTNALLNQRVCKLREDSSMNTHYAFYMLSSPLKAINSVTYATTVKHLSVYDIYNVFIPVPPIPEQAAIASYLDHKCANIDTSISNAQHQIDLLQEYKQSLITEVVTGKRKVTDN